MRRRQFLNAFAAGAAARTAQAGDCGCALFPQAARPTDHPFAQTVTEVRITNMKVFGVSLRLPTRTARTSS